MDANEFDEVSSNVWCQIGNWAQVRFNSHNLQQQVVREQDLWRLMAATEKREKEIEIERDPLELGMGRKWRSFRFIRIAELVVY